MFDFSLFVMKKMMDIKIITFLLVSFVLLSTGKCVNAQKLKLTKGNAGYFYDDCKLDSLQRQRLSLFLAEGNASDSLKIQEITNRIGNQIIPKEVRQILKDEFKKGDEGGYLDISFYFDEKGNIYSARIRVLPDSLFHKLSPYIEKIYDNLMEIKIDMTLLENVKRSREKEKTSVNNWFVIFGKPFRLLLPWLTSFHVVLE